MILGRRAHTRIHDGNICCSRSRRCPFLPCACRHRITRTIASILGKYSYPKPVGYTRDSCRKVCGIGAVRGDATPKDWPANRTNVRVKLHTFRRGAPDWFPHATMRRRWKLPRDSVAGRNETVTRCSTQRRFIRPWNAYPFPSFTDMAGSDEQSANSIEATRRQMPHRAGRGSAIRASPRSRVSLLIIRLQFRAPGRSARRRRRVSIINRLSRLPSWTST